MAYIIGAAIGAALYYLIDSFISSGAPLVPTSLIKNSEAVDMINSYGQGKEEGYVKSGHLPLNDLLGYIAITENEVEDLGVTFSGLEIFFAKYDETIDSNIANANSNTFVIYPTYAAGAGKHVPFDPISSTSGNIVDVDLLMADSRFSANASALNRMHMRPPN